MLGARSAPLPRFTPWAISRSWASTAAPRSGTTCGVRALRPPRTPARLSGASGGTARSRGIRITPGLVTIDGGTAGRIQAIDQAYLDNLRYLRPDAGGATSSMPAGRRKTARHTTCWPSRRRRRHEVDLWIDPETHLIARETRRSEPGYRDDRRFELSPHRRHHVSFLDRTQTSSGNSFAERIIVARAQHRRCRTNARSRSERARLIDFGRHKHDRSAADR